MKILYFHQYYSTPIGFGGTRAYEMSKALASAGHEVHIVCGSSAKHDSGLTTSFANGRRTGIVDGIKITQLQLEYSNYDNTIRRSIKFIRFALSGIKIALTENYDLLFATSTPLTAGIPGIAARWLRKKDFVFEVRDLWPELPREMGVIKNPLALSAMSLLEWLSYRSAKACIGLSPGIVEGIKRRSRTSLPVTMIPNGCDLDLFKNQHPSDHITENYSNITQAESKNNQPVTNVDDVTSEYSITGTAPSDFVAIFTGAHGTANGLHAVLDSAEILKSRNINDIKLVFIGDGKEKPGLLQRKDSQQLDNCIFIDPVQKNQLPRYMSQADAALMILSNIPAFYYGTSPNKFFDYLAMGLPIVNNYPGWLADQINEYNIGVVVEPDSPEQLADALINLSAIPNELKNMGKRARELGESSFDRKLLAREFVSFLETNHPR